MILCEYLRLNDLRRVWGVHDLCRDLGCNDFPCIGIRLLPRTHSKKTPTTKKQKALLPGCYLY